MGVRFNDTVHVYDGKGIKTVRLDGRRCRPGSALEEEFNNFILYKLLRIVMLHPHNWMFFDIGTFKGFEEFLKRGDELTREYIRTNVLNILDCLGSSGAYVLNYKKSVRLPYNLVVSEGRTLSSVLKIWLMRVVYEKYSGKDLGKYKYIATKIQKNVRGYIVRNRRFIKMRAGE